MGRAETKSNSIPITLRKCIEQRDILLLKGTEIPVASVILVLGQNLEKCCLIKPLGPSGLPLVHLLIAHCAKLRAALLEQLRKSKNLAVFR